MKTQQERRAATEIPTFVIGVFWKHKQAQRERKTLIRRHADGYWSLHVGTRQDITPHMQVARFNPRRGRKNNRQGPKYVGIWCVCTRKQDGAEREYLNS